MGGFRGSIEASGLYYITHENGAAPLTDDDI